VICAFRASAAIAIAAAAADIRYYKMYDDAFMSVENFSLVWSLSYSMFN